MFKINEESVSNKTSKFSEYLVNISNFETNQIKIIRKFDQVIKSADRSSQKRFGLRFQSSKHSLMHSLMIKNGNFF
jgi:hypothetical protein